MKTQSTAEQLQEIKEYKTYETKKHGSVKILKKNSEMWGSAGQKRDDQECIRVKKENGTAWIPISDIIIPAKKGPLTGAERKRRFDEKQKSLSKNRVTLDLDYDAYRLIEMIQEGIVKSGSKRNFSEIASSLLMLVSEKKSINVLVQLLLKQCDKTGMADWCCNTDIKRVQLKNGTNLYEGKKVWMCKECRKANNGSFKIIKERHYG